MAYGLRIVAVASDGVRGVLPEEYPYLCPTGDAPKLARVLWECCHDLKNGGRPDLPARLRSRFVENFTSEAFAGNFIRVWREFGNEKQPRPQRDGVRDDALKVVVYLADQNPGFDRSYGISRMTQIMLGVLRGRNEVALEPVMSKSSRFEIGEGAAARILPWGTKNKITRLLTDHLSPLLLRREKTRAIYYYPKGYLPLLSRFVSPSVVTIHDTIIQYDEDNYPRWRRTWEYKYWSWMLRHTLKNADRILTVSLSSRDQIRNFMGRHNLPSKEITVSYEPCLYERIPQPRGGEKEDFVLHLASVEPHKRTTHLIRWWVELERQGIELPPLHLVGNVPREAAEMLTRTSRVLRSPFLPDDELQDKYRKARALVLPSEIEGFGLPALESYYLGTPVCYVKGTSVEEVLSPAIRKGGFDLSDPLSLVRALEEVLALGEDEIHDCGLILRREYAASRVAEKMISVFQSLAPR
jgi:glycosyltransferase involved in cell wall biosynthesis